MQYFFALCVKRISLPALRSLIKQFKFKFMKSTQKFLCYSIALVGAALILSAGCKKDCAPSTTTVVASTKPSLNFGSLTLTGASSATVVASEILASIGSSSVTVVGFNFAATGTITGSLSSVTYTGSVTSTIPGGANGAGAFTDTLLTPAALAALSGSITITWSVSSYATNSVGTTTSSSAVTLTTIN